MVGGRAPEKIAQVARTIEAEGNSAEPLTVDVTREADVVRAFDRAFAPGAGLEPADLVANNRKLDFRELSAESVDDRLRHLSIPGLDRACWTSRNLAR